MDALTDGYAGILTAAVTTLGVCAVLVDMLRNSVSRV